jgi:hypothetical protein
MYKVKDICRGHIAWCDDDKSMVAMQLHHPPCHESGMDYGVPLCLVIIEAGAIGGLYWLPATQCRKFKPARQIATPLNLGGHYKDLRENLKSRLLHNHFVPVTNYAIEMEPLTR